jgi:hypothetical protein
VWLVLLSYSKNAVLVSLQHIIDIIRMIYENLRGTNPSDISNCIGIQFLGIFIANDLCPFNDPGIDKDR